MKKIEFTSEEIHEIENYVIKAFDRRAKAQGYKVKNYWICKLNLSLAWYVL